MDFSENKEKIFNLINKDDCEKDKNISSKDILNEAVNSVLKKHFLLLDGAKTLGLFKIVMSSVEEPLISISLKYCNFNQIKTAKMLGISRGTLRKKINEYGIITNK